MPTVHKNITCVSYSELVGAGLISEPNYKLMVHRGRIKKVVAGGNGREALVDFNSLPCDLKNEVIKAYGDPRNNYCKEVFKSDMETNYAAREFFSSYILADGRNLPNEIQEKYSCNAEVLDCLIKSSNNSKAFGKALGGNNSSLWANLTQIVASLENEIGHDLPKNERRLKLKCKEYQEKGFECLISGKFLNKNRTKVGDIEQEATLRQIFRKHNNFDNVQVADIYNFFGEKLGWEKITSSTVANYRTKYEMDTVAFRRGTSNFDNTKAMLAKRSAPVLPLVYWTADGWDVELLYQKNEDGKTTYHNRLTVVIVLDPCGKYPVGYAIGKHESKGLIKQAFRNAVNHTAELFGAMHKVGQLQTDNYGRGALVPFYEAVSDKYTPAKIGNAKAKTIEPYFKYLNKKYCQLMPNWSGFGILANKESQPNAQWINQHRHEIPTIEGVIEQIERIIAIERNLKSPAYTKAYEQLPQEERLLLSEHDYYLHLCETNEKTIRLSHEGIVNQINGDKRVYDSFDPRFRNYRHIDWQIKYDPTDRSKVMAVNADGTLRFMLEEKYIQPMALRDRTEMDAQELAKINQFNTSLKQRALDVAVTDDKVLANVKHLIEDMQDTELLDNKETEMYKKLLITDSLGQHKDRKNNVVEKSQKLLAKQLEREERKTALSQAEEHNEYLASKVNVASYLTEE